MLWWAFVSDAIPIYPLYALLFTDSGLSGAEISALFGIWSGVGLVAEVPSGALADRVSRRGALVAAGLLQAVGYVVWILQPTFAGFAIGFVLWGLGGSLISGAREALLYDGLLAARAEGHYARINGWVVAAGLIASLPTALAATVLFAHGGYLLVGWVSVGCCLAAASIAATLPEPPRVAEAEGEGGEPGDGAGYLDTLRAGISQASARPGLRATVLAVALLGAFDAIEEYFPLLTEGLGVPVAAVPLAMVPVAFVGAMGPALGGAVYYRLRPLVLAVILGTSMLMLACVGLIQHPAGIACLAVFYGLYRAVLVAVEARLQARIDSRSRATITSVGALGTEIATFAVYLAWAAGEVVLLAALGMLIALALPRLLREPP